VDWRGASGVVVEVVEGDGVERERLERRVSWMPGAEGAPRVDDVDLEVLVEGVMRRACGCVRTGEMAVLWEIMGTQEGRTIVIFGVLVSAVFLWIVRS